MALSTLNSFRDGVNEFTCMCVDGYTGNTCAEDIDECSSNPCVNSGECENLINSYQCKCLNGFNGVNCEEDIDECLR